MNWRAFWCRLRTRGRHYYELKAQDGRVWLRCSHCQHATSGIVVEDVPQQSFAEPEPVPVDWFEAEHFQGDHAR